MDDSRSCKILSFGNAKFDIFLMHYVNTQIVDMYGIRPFGMFCVTYTGFVFNDNLDLQTFKNIQSFITNIGNLYANNKTVLELADPSSQSEFTILMHELSQKMTATLLPSDTIFME